MTFQPKLRDGDADSAHASAMFGGDMLSITPNPAPQINDINSIMHPNVSQLVNRQVQKYTRYLTV